MYQPDATDKAILNLLQKDAKITIKEIANQLKLSTTPVFERIKRLERNNIIQKYTAMIDRKKVALALVAFCDVSLKEHAEQYLVKFEQEVQSLSEVVECYHIAGTYDYLLKVVVKDMEAYQHFVSKKLAVLENIGRVQSSFVMKEIKNFEGLPIS
jgi:DNA-binding Lrp family transcriptional regulator